MEALSITDTLYNLAITPDGNRIIFKKYEYPKGEEVSKTYIVDREGPSWGTPKEVNTLYNINAGYFQPLSDKSLVMFARLPRPGIYISYPDDEKIYSIPKWVDDMLVPDSTTSFDAFLNKKKNKLIITRAVYKKDEETIGPDGFFYYRKINGEWLESKRLPLPYGWGATVTSNDEFIFVRNRNLQILPLSDLEISW